MVPSRPRHCFLVIAFVLILAAPPVVQVGLDMANGRSPGCLALLTRRPTVTHLRGFEEDLEADSWFANWARPLVQQARFRLFADPGQNAIVGRRGWLFYTPGVQYITDSGKARDAAMRDCIAAVCDFNAQLASRGIHLVVVPAPGKASIYPDMLGRRASREAMESPTRGLLRELKAEGVDVVDLFAVFAQARRDAAAEQPLYLAQDTHWSPAGAHLAAETVAAHVLSAGRIIAGAVNYDTEPVAVSRMGDIIRMARVPAMERNAAPQTVQCLRVIDPRTGAPYSDDDAAPVLVLGDSFLRIYESDKPGSAGFTAHLARALKQPVTSIVNDGGASTLVRQALSRRPELLEGKRIAIWEFVERDIRFGAEGWQRVDLPDSGPAGDTGPRP